MASVEGRGTLNVACTMGRSKRLQFLTDREVEKDVTVQMCVLKLQGGRGGTLQGHVS